MCVGGGGSPSPPPPPPRAPEAPMTPEPTAKKGVDDTERRRRVAAGESGAGTILTGSRGVQDGGAVTKKTLLGQ